MRRYSSQLFGHVKITYCNREMFNFHDGTLSLCVDWIDFKQLYVPLAECSSERCEFHILEHLSEAEFTYSPTVGRTSKVECVWSARCQVRCEKSGVFADHFRKAGSGGPSGTLVLHRCGLLSPELIRSNRRSFPLCPYRR